MFHNSLPANKDALVEAVIDQRILSPIQRGVYPFYTFFAKADVHEKPLARLQAIIGSYHSRVEAEAEIVTAYGCPYASLLDDLSKLGSKHLQKAGDLKLYVDNVHRQGDSRRSAKGTRLKIWPSSSSAASRALTC